MKLTQVNPWNWQDSYGFAQAWRVQGAASLIFVSGQAAISPEGEVLHPDDFRAQAWLTFENLRTVLEQAGGSLESVVKLGAYVLDMANLADYAAIHAEFFVGHRPAQTLVQVAGLALPGMQIEVEAYAVSGK